MRLLNLESGIDILKVLVNGGYKSLSLPKISKCHLMTLRMTLEDE